MKLMKRTIALFAGAMLAFALCAGSARADDTLQIVDGGPGPNIYDTLRFVAQGAGFLKQAHLVIDQEYTGTGLTAAQLVATGKGDILASTIEPILEGYEKGLRFQVFFTRSSRYAYVLAVLNDSPITSLADFKGATVGEINVGSGAEVATNSMLSGAGLKKSDYSFLPIGAGAQALQAIVTKRVAAVAFPGDLIALYELQGNVTFRLFHHPILEAGNSVYAASASTIQNKADALKRFTRALAQAAVFVRHNPRAAARYYLQGAGVKITDEAIDNEAKFLVLSRDYIAGADPANMRIGYTSPQATALYSRVLVGAGMATQVVPADAVVTNQFIGFANAFDRQTIITLANQTH
jgi:NitT/TauT family transport system substrate-binding protein